MNLKKRSLIFVTFFLSCLAIALLGASLGTKVGILLIFADFVGVGVADQSCEMSPIWRIYPCKI